VSATPATVESNSDGHGHGEGPTWVFSDDHVGHAGRRRGGRAGGEGSARRRNAGRGVPSLDLGVVLGSPGE